MLSRNEEKKICRPTIISSEATIARRSSESAPSPCSIQCTTMISADHKAAERDEPAEREAVLEAEAGPHRVEPGILLAHEVRAVGVRAQTEREDLSADDRQQCTADQRMQVPSTAEDVDLRRAR